MLTPKMRRYFALSKGSDVSSPRPVAFYYGGPFYNIWWSQPRKWISMMREDHEKLGAWAFFADDAEMTARDVQQRDLYALLG